VGDPRRRADRARALRHRCRLTDLSAIVTLA
jgi:hypothetical protein